eukprot:GEMP01017053.1.p1 GENE.GEMP01017053.1~~GEMP01017053.1.p1  ORF type:complete len:511 (+),score=127.53 GEMP01017053.1:88-1620(+)
MVYCFTCEKVVDGNKLSSGDIQCTICRGMFVVEDIPDEAERQVDPPGSANMRNTEHKCARGHWLNEQRLHATRWCDVCNEKLITGTFALSCVPCDYDLCAECEADNARAMPRNVVLSTIGANSAIVPGIMLGMNSMIRGFAAAFEPDDDTSDGRSEEDAFLTRVTRGIGRGLDVLMETEGLTERDLSMLASMRANFQEGANADGGMRGWIGHLVNFMEEQLGGHWEEETSGLTEKMLDEHLQECITDAPKADGDDGEWICPICTEPTVESTAFPFPVRGRKRKSSRRASDQSSTPHDDSGRVAAARARPAPVDVSAGKSTHVDSSFSCAAGSTSHNCPQPGRSEPGGAPSTNPVTGGAPSTDPATSGAPSTDPATSGAPPTDPVTGGTPSVDPVTGAAVAPAVAVSSTDASLGASHPAAGSAAAIGASPPADATTTNSRPAEVARAVPVSPCIGGFIVRIVCGHYFHFSCLREWLKRKDACPMCRREPIVGASGSGSVQSSEWENESAYE